MGRDISTITPTTIGGIKRLAKQYKKAGTFPDEGHTKLLDRAAQKAGYANYTHAFNALGGPNATEQQND